MVALFLVAGEICVGLFKTFFQLGEGSTFVQLVCICVVLNGRQIKGAQVRFPSDGAGLHGLG